MVDSLNQSQCRHTIHWKTNLPIKIESTLQKKIEIRLLEYFNYHRQIQIKSSIQWEKIRLICAS